jgi:chromosome segregation ATPase
MARIDENQAHLQMMVKANSLQITDIASRLEENQQELQAVIGSLQNDVAKVSADVAAVADAQMKLHETVQTGSLQVTDKITAIGQTQKALSTSLGQAIAGVRGETQKVAADVTAVTAEQAKLYETVQENNLQLTDKVTVIEQAQRQRHNTIGSMEDNINALASSISGLGEDVLKLQEILQSNIRELVSIAEVSGQKNDEFQQSITTNLQTLDESLTSLKANQDNLQSRIEQMKNEAPDLRDMPAAIDQLREQLEELSRSRMPADEVGTIEYEAQETETDSIE